MAAVLLSAIGSGAGAGMSNDQYLQQMKQLQAEQQLDNFQNQLMQSQNQMALNQQSTQANIASQTNSTALDIGHKAMKNLTDAQAKIAGESTNFQ